MTYQGTTESKESFMNKLSALTQLQSLELSGNQLVTVPERRGQLRQLLSPVLSGQAGVRTTLLTSASIEENLLPVFCAACG